MDLYDTVKHRDYKYNSGWTYVQAV